jgi:hypothetical protein
VTVAPDAVILAMRIAIVLLLYAFLVALVAAARRDLWTLAATEPAAPRGPTEWGHRLLLLHAGSGSQSPGLAFDLRGPTGIGRARDNQLILDDEFVSAHHARLEPRDGGWWLSDLGSTNGTLLNDRPVRGDTAVRPGDVIGVGGARIKLARREGTP